MMTLIDSGGIAMVAFSSDNGVRLSVIFGACTYSDNYHGDFDQIKADGAKSATVEILQTDGNPALNKWIHKHYGTYTADGDPIAYVPVSALPAILKRADSPVYKAK